MQSRGQEVGAPPLQKVASILQTPSMTSRRVVLLIWNGAGVVEVITRPVVRAEVAAHNQRWYLINF